MPEVGRAVNEVSSLFRTIRLSTPPPDGTTHQCLLVPAGATDRQVLEWAAEVLDPDSYEELRQRVADDAHGEYLAEALGLDPQVS